MLMLDSKQEILTAVKRQIDKADAGLISYSEAWVVVGSIMKLGAVVVDNDIPIVDFSRKKSSARSRYPNI